MRLPWPFRRSSAAPRSPVASAASGSATPSEPAPEPAPAPPSGPRHEWRSLTPLLETIGEPPLVAPPRPFKQALAVNQASPPALAPLGHQRSLAAPGGLLLGVARPLPAAAGGQAALQLRRPAGVARAWSGEVQAVGTDADAGQPAEARRTLDAASPPSMRRLPAADRAPAAWQRSLARLEPADLALLPPAPPAGTLRQSPARAQPRTAIDAAQPAETPPLPAQPAGPRRPESVPPSPGGPRPVPGSRPTLGQSRRLGLGAPLPALPPSAVQRASETAGLTGPIDAPLATHQPARRAPATDTSGPAPIAAGEPAAAPPPTEASRSAALPAPPPSRAGDSGRTSFVPGALPVLRLATPLPAVNANRPRRRYQDGPRSSTATPTPSRGRASRSVAPLLASRPLRSRMQRAPSAASDGEQPSSGAALGQGPLDGPVRVHRGSEASEAAAAFQARAFTHGGDVFLPARHGPLSSGTARSLLAHELVHVAQQRSLGGELPGEDSPHGRALEAQARAAEMGGEAPLVLAASGRAGRDVERATGDGVMRSPQAETLDGQEQLEPQPTGTTETAIVQLSTVQRAAEAPSSAAPTVASSGTTRSEQELEELARQLYGRIHLRLRRELMVDRERAGLVFDGR